MSNSGFYKSVLIEEHIYCHGFNFFFLDGYIIPQLELYCLYNVAAFLLDIVLTFTSFLWTVYLKRSQSGEVRRSRFEIRPWISAPALPSLWLVSPFFICKVQVVVLTHPVGMMVVWNNPGRVLRTVLSQNKYPAVTLLCMHGGLVLLRLGGGFISVFQMFRY